MKATVTRNFQPDYVIHHAITHQDREITIELNIKVDGEPFEWIKHNSLLSMIIMPTPENGSRDKKLTEPEKAIQLISMSEMYCMLKNLGKNPTKVKKKKQQVIYD